MNSTDADKRIKEFDKKFEQEIFEMFENSMYNNESMLKIIDNVRRRIAESGIRSRK